jgi:hypothetical protein
MAQKKGLRPNTQPLKHENNDFNDYFGKYTESICLQL